MNGAAKQGAVSLAKQLNGTQVHWAVGGSAQRDWLGFELSHLCRSRTLVITGLLAASSAESCSRQAPPQSALLRLTPLRRPAHMACCAALQQRPGWAAPRASLPPTAAGTATARRQAAHSTLLVAVSTWTTYLCIISADRSIDMLGRPPVICPH